MDNQFNIHHWSDPEPKDVKTFIHNYSMGGTEFPEWEMEEVLPAIQTYNALIRQFIWNKKNVTDEVFKVDVISAFSYEDAKGHFQELLQQNMRPLEEFKKLESVLGNNAYVDYQEEMSYGLFLLANVVIRIHSVGNTTIACNGFIKEVYRILDGTYAENITDTASTAPVSLLTSPQGNEILTRVSTVLNIQAPEWYKLLLDGPGTIRFHNGNLEYFSEEPGLATLELYTIRKHEVLKNTLMLTVQ